MEGRMTEQEQGLESLPSLARQHLMGRTSRRRFLGQALALGLTVSGAEAFLAACGGSSTPSGPIPRTLTVITGDDLQVADPSNYLSQSDNFAIDLVNEGLISYKPGTWDVVNTLASEFKESADHLSYSFTLKPGIQFHGGYGEVTADDVKFSYERIAGLTTPNINSPFAGDWEPLQQVEVTGKYTGVIHLKHTFAPLLRTTLPLTSGYVLSRKAVTEKGQNYKMHPIGTGPYQLTEFVSKDHLTFTRFKDYGGAQNSAIGGAPQWDTILMKIVSDQNAIEVALEGGQVDFAQLGTQSVDRLKSRGFNVQYRPSLSYDWVSINMTHPVLSDINVREAIRHAIDIPSVIKAAYDGKAERSYAIIPQSMGIGFWADAPHYDRDLAKAKDFISRSGFKSSDLAFNLYCYDNATYRNGSLVMQSNLNDAGFNITFKPLAGADSSNYGHGASGMKTATMNFNGFSSAPDPYFSLEWFTCSQVQAWNWMGFCNPDFDNLLTQANQTFDAKQRTDLFVKAQKLMDQSASTVWVDFPATYFASKSSLKPVLRPDGLWPVHLAFRSA
jgi:peptide/nickel transport system substrate-binding protein